MMFRPAPRRLVLAAALAALFPQASDAVYLNGDGQGQALIFPYYTVRDGRGGTFNTYLSVVNATTAAKALRVRFREGRNGKPVGDFNLYIGPNDVWTAAVVPNATGTSVLSVDRSCTDPVVGDGSSTARPAYDLTNLSFSGANDDGGGTGLDRTREGYVEVLEMSVLTGASAAATRTVNGVPSCAGLGAVPAAQTGAPAGGLSGSLTLINVADGSDYSVNATALDEVFTRALWRPAADGYPALNAAEVSNVSTVTANGSLYRSEWPTGLDAVNATLMAESLRAEYVLDAVTNSATDLVISYPTRPLSVGPAGARPPFTKATWPNCAGPGRNGDLVSFTYFNREQAGAVAIAFDAPLLEGWATCAAVVVLPIVNKDDVAPLSGSTPGGATLPGIRINSGFQNGYIQASFYGFNATTTSLGTSARVDVATGAATQGGHTYKGLPITGFVMRSLQNGTLSCSGGTCQGNYGSAFPFRTQRNITPN